jgi:hypothetical protein
LDFRGGLNVSRNFLADLDFTYNQWGLTVPRWRASANRTGMPMCGH